MRRRAPFILGLTAAASLMLVVAWRMRVVDQRAACLANLKSFLEGIEKHGLPAQVQTSREAVASLLAAGLLAPDTTRCPVTGDEYVIVLPAGGDGAGDARVIVHETVSRAHEGANAFFGDGHGEFLSRHRFQELGLKR
jgi:hypothetical protein